MSDWLHSWGIAADIFRVDTHVYWGATSVANWKAAGVQRDRLFDRRVCSWEMFKDLIERSVITEVKSDPQSRKSFSGNWKTIEAMVKGEQNLQSDPDARVHGLEYEVAIQAVGEDSVRFNLELWGYKYGWGSIELPELCFYELADRLDANVRFQVEWSPVDEPTARLQAALEDSLSLQLIRDRLEPLLDRIPRDYAPDLEGLAGDALVLFEKLLRKVRQQVGWSRQHGSAGGLNPLIDQLKSGIYLPQDQESLLRIIAKPYRDYVLHGHDMPAIIARPVLGTSLELLRMLSGTLDTELGNRLRP